MSRVDSECDCMIVGAGVVGLWLRALLHAQGRSVVTVERTAAGDGQSVASQGILHRGLKYRVSPEAQRAAEELLRAQAMWNDAFSGRGPVRLSGVRFVAPHMHMWAPAGGVGGFLAKATASMASLVMSSDAKRLEVSERPPAFRSAHPDTAIFEVAEQCVDPRSLMRSLIELCASPILRDQPELIEQNPEGVRVKLTSGKVIVARTLFACAGEGNDRIIRLVGADPDSLMQRRPLAMVAAAQAPFDLFGHCIKPMSDKPRITVTTTTRGDQRYWWLGGSLAEDGVELSDDQQIAAARDIVSQCLPWVDSSGLLYSVHRINRAEGRMKDGSRPEGPVVHTLGRVHVVWPTKLALAPIAASICASKVAESTDASDAATACEIGVADEPWLKGGVLWK